MRQIIIMVLGLSAIVLADMTPQKYWELEIKIRALTIDGMQKRVECLEESNCSLDREMVIFDKSQEKIVQIFKEFDTTPSKELVYENRNKKLIEEYFENNQSIQEEIDSLKEKFENYSNQLSTIMENRS